MLLARLALADLGTIELSKQRTWSCMTYMSVESYIRADEGGCCAQTTFTHLGMLTIVVGVGVDESSGCAVDFPAPACCTVQFPIKVRTPTKLY